ncbi:MAG TPA: hypothetical protein VIF37_06405 [Methylobacter sp.]
MPQLTARKGGGLPQLSRIGGGLPRLPALTARTADIIKADPFFQNVSLLLHFDGDEGSASVIDLSPRPKIVTVVGNARITKTWAKYGTGSLLTDGAGGYFRLADHADFQFGTADLTIEVETITTVTGTIYDGRPTGTQGNYIYWHVTGSGLLNLYVNSALRAAGTIDIRQFTDGCRLRLERESGVTSMYVNEVIDGQWPSDTTNYINGTARPVAGIDGFDLSSNPSGGKWKEYRVTKGVARPLFPICKTKFSDY